MELMWAKQPLKQVHKEKVYFKSILLDKFVQLRLIIVYSKYTN